MVVSSQLPHQSINHGTAAPNSANGGTTVVAANSASNALAEIADIFDELEASVNRKAKGSKNKKPLKANSALNSLETSNGLPVISSQRTLITTDVLLHRNAMGEYIPGKNGQPLTRNEWPSPGPLDYSPKLPRAGPEFSILGKSNREEFHGDSPGPGYNFSYKVVMTKSPHYSIGMKIKEVEGKNDTPSPLTYNINHKSIGTEGISYSVAGKYHELVPPDGPSPQKYNVSASIGDDSGFSFGLKPGVKGLYY